MSKYFITVILLIAICTSAYAEDEKKEPEFRGRKLSEWLSLLLTSKDRKMRESAAYALGEIGDKSAVPALITALKDKSGALSLYASDALAKIGDERAIPELISMFSVRTLSFRGEYGSRIYSPGGPVVRGLVLFGKAAIPALSKGLQHEDSNIRAKCAEALGLIIGEDIVPTLIKCLADKDPYVREAVATTLGSIGDNRAIESLIKASQDEEGRVSHAAILALTKIDDKRARLYILDLISDKKPLYIDYHICIKAIGYSGDKRAIPILISALKSNDFQTVDMAAQSLVRIGDESAVPALIEILKGGTKNVRPPMAKALGDLRAKPAVPALIESLKSEEQWIRREGAIALGKIGDKSAIPALEALLEDKSIYVRICAAEALCELGQKKTGMPVLTNALSIKEKSVGYPTEYPYLEAAAALYMLGDEKGLKILQEAMKGPKNLGSFEAKSILCRVADKSAVPALIDVLKESGSIFLPYFALEALERINDSNTIPLLLDSLNEGSDNLRIFSALKKLSGRNFGTDKDKWQAWWKANKKRIMKKKAKKNKGGKK